MSIFERAGQMMGSAPGGNALQAILGMVNNHPGGIAGLASAFEQQGLGGVVQSWIGTGQNQPVSGEQVQSALGHERVEEVASKLGVPSETASSTIAQYLPQIVDHLTPNGQVPPSGTNLLGMGEGLLKGLFK